MLSIKIKTVTKEGLQATGCEGRAHVPDRKGNETQTSLLQKNQAQQIAL